VLEIVYTLAEAVGTFVVDTAADSADRIVASGVVADIVVEFEFEPEPDIALAA